MEFLKRYKKRVGKPVFVYHCIFYYGFILPIMVSFLLLAGFGIYSYADTVTKTIPVGPYPASVSANDLDFTFMAATAINGAATDFDTFVATGKELLIVRFNNTVNSGTFTLDSVADNYNRQNDITEYTLSGSEFAVFAFTASAGWKTATGNIRINAGTSSIEWAVIQLPR